MLRRRLAEKRRQKANKAGSNNHGEEGEDDWVLEDENVDSTEEGSGVDDKVWSQEDKAIYEEQLEHLHNQLSEALIENRELKIELKDQKSSVGAADCSRPKEAKKKSPSSYGHYGGSNLSVSTIGEGFESVSTQPSIQRDTGSIKLIDKVKNMIFSILYDFTEDTFTEDTAANEAQPLQAKRLKANVQRLAMSSQPYRDFGEFAVGILQWKNPSLSLVMFLLYMYCVWNGWIIQLILVIAIGYLTFNYLRVIGIVEQFGFEAKGKGNSDEDYFGSLGLADKFQLVKEIGQMAQNYSEMCADNLEKGQNLLLWYYPQATRKIFTMLCVSLLVSLLLPNTWTLTIVGFVIGYKVFIIDNIYRKYPKVKEKYDGLARMWKALPTNKQLEQRQRMTEEDLSASTMTERSSSSDFVSVSVADTLFTDRFQLSPTELPLEGWQSGKRCTLIDKERPLANSKSGRLFLTHSFVCFERSPRPSDISDRFAIPLKDITSIAKAKPFAVLPGSGMSVEILLKHSSKPVIFGAILHRDQAYLSICDQAMILGLNWGSDPETVESSTTGGLEPTGTAVNNQEETQ